ncbi:uncharacterized protein LOC126824466 [Patella vulgata]|uniref:uncharacterized protein LOC126824466 n=1 Tax=Patella vulgata TaxID=6465 RepID=UPI0024A958DA|nr:uncharacterized protein LOC126824466 [Patella vulgata]
MDYPYKIYYRYLYLRGFHDRGEVLKARLEVLKYLKSTSDDILSSDQPLEVGVLKQGCGVGCVPFMEGKNVISHADPVRKVLEGPKPFKFFKNYFGGREVRTFDFKWLRAVHTEGFTGAHVDNVYMGRGSKELLTMWTPFGDITADMGVLAMCEGSHRLPSFAKFQEKYGNLDVEAVGLKGTGWFTCDPYEITDKFGGQWKTTNFQAGDVMIFSMRTVHMSTVNLTNFARISCDTRWQPLDDVADPRYIGDFQTPGTKFGLYSTDESKTNNGNTMEHYRIKWGF